MVQFPWNVNSYTYRAPLISSKEEGYYKYTGRFATSTQAHSICKDVSQKAHAMLKYLIAAHSYRCHTQAVIAWAIDNGESQIDPFASTNSLYGAAVKDENVSLQEAQGELATDYTKKLRVALAGMGEAKILESNARRIAVMAVDVAVGRMGITFYQDLSQNDYIKRILAWHESCKWWFRYDGQDSKSAPSANRIIAAVYGEPKGEGYKKIQKQARERLLHHIVCGQPLDRGWVSAAVSRVSQPLAFDKLYATREKDGWNSKGAWDHALSVTCAIVRKYHAQKKEEFNLELDNTCTDRGYLFGRLLAIADRLESHARYLQDKTSSTEKRPTNAVRYMSAFSSKPLRTWALIFNQLNPYIQRLNGAEWYQQQIDEIMSLFQMNELDDRPLDGKYLLGYSLQRRALNKKREETSHEPNKEG